MYRFKEKRPTSCPHYLWSHLFTVKDGLCSPQIIFRLFQSASRFKIRISFHENKRSMWGKGEHHWSRTREMEPASRCVGGQEFPLTNEKLEKQNGKLQTMKLLLFFVISMQTLFLRNKYWHIQPKTPFTSARKQVVNTDETLSVSFQCDKIIRNWLGGPNY